MDRRKRIWYAASAAVLGLAFFTFFLFFAPADSTPSPPVLFSVYKGQSSNDIARALRYQGLIRSETAFTVYIRITGIGKQLKAGEYELNSSMNVHVIAQKLVRGEISKELLTIPEGWNLRDIAARFAEKELSTQEELFAAAGIPGKDYAKDNAALLPTDFSAEYAFLAEKPKGVGLEGYLFPDTYHLPKGSTIEDIVKQILENFDRKFTADMRAQILEQEKTIFEIVTMASLIEKEVQTEEDKHVVSGILWKRIDAGMPLQVNATISYITGKKSIKVSIQETQIDSRYNTYKYKGLPLGPIANPGLESIQAALEPISSPYWYYLSTPAGKTIFSKTLEEHSQAKAKYLK